MNQRRAFGNRLIDRLENRIEQSNGNRMCIANWKLKITDARDAVFDALLAQGDDGLNLMNVVSGQPLRVGKRAQEESRGDGSYRRGRRVVCHPLVYEVAL